MILLTVILMNIITLQMNTNYYTCVNDHMIPFAQERPGGTWEHTNDYSMYTRGSSSITCEVIHGKEG